MLTNLPRILFYLIKSMSRMKWDKAKLKKYQEKRLRHIINYAYNKVPIYRKKFKQLQITPNNIKDLSDLNKIPIMKKDELRQLSQNQIISQDYIHNINHQLREVTTSGSTGKPLKILLTGTESDWRKAIYMRANISCGQRPRDKWVVVTSPRHFGDTTRIQRILGIYEQTCVSVFNDINAQVQTICRVKPNILDGYSSSISLLAKKIEQVDCKINPKIVFGNAEVINDKNRKDIERVFNAPYCDQYGSVEFNRTAWQCLEREGYHMDVDSVITQFIDDEGNEVSAGEKGNIVQTSLFNLAMPFLRYEVGDIGVPSDDECSCGINLPLMKSVEGRRDSLIILPSGRTLSPRAFTVSIGMFKNYDIIDQFRVIQQKRDLIEIQLKLKYDNIDHNLLIRDLKEHVSSLLNLSNEQMYIDVNIMTTIDKMSTGKLEAVISKIKHHEYISLKK